MGINVREVKDSPSVSVVVPVYNVAPYVERSVLSVMHQSYPANECIIVDDASTDDSIIRCMNLIDKYNGPTRFFILSHDHNRGLSAARNTGTDAATSEYIYYLDSDDEMAYDCLEKMSKPLTRDRTIEMVLGEYEVDYSAFINCKWGRLIKKSHFSRQAQAELYSNGDIRKWYFSIKGGKPDQVWNKLLRVSLIKDHNLYNREGLLYEDILWSFYLMRCVSHVALVKETTYIHHRRRGSIVTSTQYKTSILHHGLIFKEIAEQAALQPDSDYRIDEIERWQPDFCNYFINASDLPDYQYAYRVICDQLKDFHRRNALHHLKIVHFFSRGSFRRSIYTFSKNVCMQLNRVMGLTYTKKVKDSGITN